MDKPLTATEVAIANESDAIHQYTKKPLSVRVWEAEDVFETLLAEYVGSFAPRDDPEQREIVHQSHAALAQLRFVRREVAELESYPPIRTEDFPKYLEYLERKVDKDMHAKIQDAGDN